MSKESIEQEKLLEKRKLILHSDRVEVRIADRKEERTSYFRYEDIGNDKQFRREKSQPNYGIHVITRNLAIITFFLRLFGAIDSWSWALAFFSSSVVFFIVHVFTYRSLIQLEVLSDDKLELFKEIPSEEEVNGFLEQLYSQRNKYLRENYFTPCDSSSEQGKSVLNWLLELNVITKPEYSMKMQMRQKPGENLN